MFTLLREPWRRLKSHRLSERLLFVAILLVVATLVVVGAALLTDSTDDTAASVTEPAVASAAPTRPAVPTSPEPGPTAIPSPTAPSEPPRPTPGTVAELKPEASPSPSPSPTWPRRVRVVNTDGEGANLRRDPSPLSQRITVAREGVELDIIGPDRRVDGETWRNVQDEDGEAGWILGALLEEIRPRGPRPTPTPVPLFIQVTEVASPVNRAGKAQLSITTRPNTRCEVRVFVFGPQSAPRQGLDRQMSNSRGECAWTWNVPDDIVPGSWRYYIIVGEGDGQVTREVSFVVT